MNVLEKESGVVELKTRLRNTWMTGDYGRFSRYMERDAEAFYRRLPVKPGARLLDVGCGAGQLSLIAARAGARVTGCDIASNWLAQARRSAAAEGLTVVFEEGDAERLPYENAAFDVVVSLIGAMFAPRPELVARELLRVSAPGGTIAMGNWTPEGFVGQMFKTFSRFLAPSGFPAPALWGDETVVRQRLGPGVSDLQTRRLYYSLTYPFPPAEVVEFFRQYYGPTNRAFSSLPDEAGKELRQQLESLWSAHNRAGDGVTVVQAEYLSVIATRA